jgi:hypothetical protein
MSFRPPKLEECCANYRNTARGNRRVLREFARLVATVPWLEEHRDWVECHEHGYGTRAFHYLWYLLVAAHAERPAPLRLLEIGVFKGQILSLVSLAGRELSVPVKVTGVSPFRGNQEPLSAWCMTRKFLTDPVWRQQRLLGNLHPGGDHLLETRRIYDAFALDFSEVRAIRGLSTDPGVVTELREHRYSIVFIDGDHSESVARSDIATYAPLVEPAGYLVIDDAGSFLPGWGFSRGVRGVSLACRTIEQSECWRNVLNVGKLRVFQRSEQP